MDRSFIQQKILDLFHELLRLPPYENDTIITLARAIAAEITLIDYACGTTLTKKINQMLETLEQKLNEAYAKEGDDELETSQLQSSAENNIYNEFKVAITETLNDFLNDGDIL